jgi:hypothetical protein
MKSCWSESNFVGYIFEEEGVFNVPHSNSKPREGVNLAMLN